MYEAGSRQSDPNHPCRRRTWHRRYRRPIQLPPLSSPRCGPRRCKTSVSADNKPATYAPQEEKTHASSRTQGTDTRQGCPRRSGEYLAMPAIHRPQMVPTELNQWDFSRQPQVAGAKSRTMLRHIGVSLPVQEGDGRQVP